MSDKLTIKEAEFVDAFMESGSNSEAYKAAYATDNMKDATIHNSGYKLAKRPHVVREIEARRADLTERCQVTQEKLILGYFKLIDDYNKGIRLAMSKKKDEQAAAYRIANFVNSASVVAALKAIAEMTGNAKVAPIAINNGMIINYIKPEK